MSNPVHDLAITPLLHTLDTLDGIVTRAEEHLAANEDIDPAALLRARLFPNMFDFVYQIRIATDVAKGAAARLAGRDVPSWADEEQTFEEVHERIGKAIEFLRSFEASDFDAALAREIALKLGPYEVTFDAAGYITKFVLPNFYFHVTTAYNILRHNGVPLGKRDYLGQL